jgi:hypothetical protein
VSEDHDRLLEEAMLQEATVAGDHVDDGVLLHYRAQKVDEETERRIDEHLATCADCRALLSALAEPVSEHQRSWAQSRVKASRRWIGVAVGTLAVAATLLFVIIRPPPRDFSEYALDGPHGLVKLDRAGTQTDRATPNSRISVRLLPPEPKDEKLYAAVYSEEGGALRRAKAEIRERRGVFALEVVGRDLFGDAFGPRRMVVVLAADEAELDDPDLDGARVRSWTFDLTYEPGAAP